MTPKKNEFLPSLKKSSRRFRSERGKPFYTFSGIPYAKPPVGRLRFRLPERADAWQGTYNATEYKKCLQSGREDIQR